MLSLKHFNGALHMRLKVPDCGSSLLGIQLQLIGAFLTDLPTNSQFWSQLAVAVRMATVQ